MDLSDVYEFLLASLRLGRRGSDLMIRSTSTFAFAVLMIATRITLQTLTRPSRSYLLATSARLALA